MTKRPFSALMTPRISLQFRPGNCVPGAVISGQIWPEPPRSPVNPRFMRIPTIELGACDPSGRAPVATAAPTVSALSP